MKVYQWTSLICLMACLLSFSSCEKDGAKTELLEISAIENSSEKINIDPAELPATSRDFIEDQYFETYIESSARVVGKGYEVILGSEEMLYFRENGIRIRVDHLRDRPQRHHPCGLGAIIDIGNLLPEITDYVLDNYPGSEILKAKRLRDFYIVLISDRVLLVFDYNGGFLHDARIFWHCTQHDEPFMIDHLPESVIQYINDNCSGCEIVRAAIIRGHLVVGVLTNEGRKIYVFTREGEFLFVRG